MKCEIENCGVEVEKPLLHNGKQVCRKCWEQLQEDKPTTELKQLRVWHFPNLGSNTFFKKEVKDINEAKFLLGVLADYDLLLGDLIDSNAQGLEVYVGTEVNYETSDGWEEWEDEEGNNIDETEEGT